MESIIPMRKILAAVLAAVFLIAAFAAVPSSAHASCSQWQLPTKTWIYQVDGWMVWLEYKNGYWYADAYGPNWQDGGRGSVRFSSATARRVSFTINWSTGGRGIYEGAIDTDGYVGGWMEDWYRPGYTTGWHMHQRARCIA